MTCIVETVTPGGNALPAAGIGGPAAASGSTFAEICASQFQPPQENEARSPISSAAADASQEVVSKAVTSKTNSTKSSAKGPVSSPSNLSFFPYVPIQVAAPQMPVITLGSLEQSVDSASTAATDAVNELDGDAAGNNQIETATAVPTLSPMSGDAVPRSIVFSVPSLSMNNPNCGNASDERLLSGPPQSGTSPAGEHPSPPVTTTGVVSGEVEQNFSGALQPLESETSAIESSDAVATEIKSPSSPGENVVSASAASGANATAPASPASLPSQAANPTADSRDELAVFSDNKETALSMTTAATDAVPRDEPQSPFLSPISQPDQKQKIVEYSPQVAPTVLSSQRPPILPTPPMMRGQGGTLAPSRMSPQQTQKLATSDSRIQLHYAANSDTAFSMPVPQMSAENGHTPTDIGTNKIAKATSIRSSSSSDSSVSSTSAAPDRVKNTDSQSCSSLDNSADLSAHKDPAPVAGLGTGAIAVSTPAAMTAMVDPSIQGADGSPATVSVFTPKSDFHGSVRSDVASEVPAASESPSGVSIGPVQAAQIVSKAAQSEMRIGLNTPSFGSVEVRTVVHANEVGVQIGSERGDLRTLLTSELPGIANALQQQNLRLNQVNFHQQGFGFSNQTSSGGDSQPRYFASRSSIVNAASASISERDDSVTPEPRNTGRRTGLSILA